MSPNHLQCSSSKSRHTVCMVFFRSYMKLFLSPNMMSRIITTFVSSDCSGCFLICLMNLDRVSLLLFPQRSFVRCVGTKMIGVLFIAYCSLCNCYPCCFQAILLFSALFKQLLAFRLPPSPLCWVCAHYCETVAGPSGQSLIHQTHAGRLTFDL